MWGASPAGRAPHASPLSEETASVHNAHRFCNNKPDEWREIRECGVGRVAPLRVPNPERKTHNRLEWVDVWCRRDARDG